MSSHSKKSNASLIAIAVSLVVLSLKFWAYWISGSAALFSDALETIVNVVTAIAALFVIRYVSQPKDEDHPYGHGKAEYFSSAFEGGLVLFAAFTIAIESISSFLQPTALKDVDQGLIFILVASAMNLLTALYLRQVAAKEKSIALKASAEHILSDVVTTIGVFAGLMLVKWTGWQWVDGLIAGAMSLHLLMVSWKILRTSISGLTDEIDGESLQSFAAALEQNRLPGVIDIHQVRAIRSGSFHHIDAHVVMPEFWNVLETHNFLHAFENKVVQSYAFEGEIAFHVDPCQRKYCSSCNLPNCGIRQQAFESLKPFHVQDLMKGPAV